MKQTHTPGPWTAYPRIPRSTEDRYSMLQAGDKVLGKVYTEHLDGEDFAKESEGQANATLIAAAPELLDGLKEAYTSLRLRDVNEASAFMTRLKAAIAKAEGRA